RVEQQYRPHLGTRRRFQSSPIESYQRLIWRESEGSKEMPIVRMESGATHPKSSSTKGHAHQKGGVNNGLAQAATCSLETRLGGFSRSRIRFTHRDGTLHSARRAPRDRSVPLWTPRPALRTRVEPSAVPPHRGAGRGRRPRESSEWPGPAQRGPPEIRED